MELYDISCIPQSAHKAFTTFIHDLYVAAPPDLTVQDLIATSGTLYKPYAVGQHYWIYDPLDPESGNVNPKWDFASTSLQDASDVETTFLVGNRTGIVPAPTDADVNAQWVTLEPYMIEGKPDGRLADQVFRLNTNGGMPPTNSVGVVSAC
jgi:hypothetical protein